MNKCFILTMNRQCKHIFSHVPKDAEYQKVIETSNKAVFKDKILIVCKRTSDIKVKVISAQT